MVQGHGGRHGVPLHHAALKQWAKDTDGGRHGVPLHRAAHAPVPYGLLEAADRHMQHSMRARTRVYSAAEALK